jgi:hypothetical protein
MKTKIFLILVFFLYGVHVYSQEKNKKDIKVEQKLENQKRTQALVDAREFIFTARTALPQGRKSINLMSRPNFVKFHPDLIEGDMPFFGSANSTVAYSGDDGGLVFNGKPENYNVTRGKNNYQVTAEVKGEKDTYRISLSVGMEGSASLSIITMNRSAISYNGEISAIESNAGN